MDHQISPVFQVKIADKNDFLTKSESDKSDIDVVWVFTFNSNRPFSGLEVAIVAFSMLVAAIITVIGVVCAWKSNFPHQNHRLLVIGGVFCYFELIFSRFSVYYFQFVNDNQLKTSGILFWAALLRYHYMFFGVHTLLSVTVERAMATVLIRDYEKKSRIWIPVLLMTCNFLFSAVFSFLAVHQFIKMRLMFLNTLITTVSAMIILEVIFWMNRRRLASLSRYHNHLQYSLSIRYQLQENVQSCKIIRAAVITVGGLIILIILTECLPVILNAPDDVRKWCNLIFDNMTHINAIFIVPTIIYIMDGFRRVFIESFWRKFKFSNSRLVKQRRKSIFSFPKNAGNNTRNEGDVYFEMFNKSVNSNK